MKDEEALSDPWILFTDRSSCIDGSEASLIITNLEGMEFTYALRFRFDATNNEAEYEALIVGLWIAEQEPGMIKYLEKVKALSNTFKELSIKQVPRGKNKNADALSKIASTSFAHLSKQVLVEELKEKSIDEKEVLAVVEEEGHTWMALIYEYLVEEILPKEKKKARDVRRKAKRSLQANYVLREIHEGTCSMHVGPRPFLKGPSKVKFLIVATDYFTKWIEAKPVATITGAQIKKFMWDNIVCRFGLPGEIISGNRKQFRDNPFKDWCEKLCIRQCFTSVKYLQANGMVERANKSLGEGIKARLDERSKN
nr:hypothetical protein [Tanacetum cinerariifolium]